MCFLFVWFGGVGVVGVGDFVLGVVKCGGVVVDLLVIVDGVKVVVDFGLCW